MVCEEEEQEQGAGAGAHKVLESVSDCIIHNGSKSVSG